MLISFIRDCNGLYLVGFIPHGLPCGRLTVDEQGGQARVEPVDGHLHVVVGSGRKRAGRQQRHLGAPGAGRVGSAAQHDPAVGGEVLLVREVVLGLAEDAMREELKITGYNFPWD